MADLKAQLEAMRAQNQTQPVQQNRVDLKSQLQQMRKQPIETTPVTTPGPTSPLEEIRSSLRTQEQEPVKGVIDTVTSAASGIKDDYWKRVDNTNKLFDNIAPHQSKVSTTFDVLGQAGGLANDIFGRAIGAVTSRLPKFLPKPKTGPEELFKPVIEAYDTAFENSPNAKRHLEAGANIASVVLPVASEIRGATKPLSATLNNSTKGEFFKGPTSPIPPKPVVDVGLLDSAISKGVKPGFTGLKSSKARDTYYANGREALQTIRDFEPRFADEAGDLVVRAPKTRLETLDALGQAKESLYKEYTKLATQAGDSGARFDASAITENLGKIANDKKYSPETRSYAEKLASDLAELHGEDPIVVQERIKDLNNSLGAFYDGRVSKSKAQIDASSANALREQLDNQINSLTGANYQQLKNKYSSLKTIEKDLARQAAIEARKNPKSLMDMTDIFTGGDIAAGVLTANPALIAKGAAARGFKEYLKWMNDPNRYIKNAFEHLYSLPIREMPVVKKPTISGLLGEGAIPLGRTDTSGFVPNAPGPAMATPVPPTELNALRGIKELPPANNAINLPGKGILEGQANIVPPEYKPGKSGFLKNKAIEGTIIPNEPPDIAKQIQKIEDNFRKEAGLMAPTEGAGVRQRNVTDAVGGVNFVANEFKLNRAKSDMFKRAGMAKDYAKQTLYENDPAYKALVDKRDAAIEAQVDVADPAEKDLLSKFDDYLKNEEEQLKQYAKEQGTLSKDSGITSENQSKTSPLKVYKGPSKYLDLPEGVKIPLEKRKLSNVLNKKIINETTRNAFGEDYAIMDEFVTHVNGKFPENIPLEIEARRMAEAMGINPDLDNKELAKILNKIVDEREKIDLARKNVLPKKK